MPDMKKYLLSFVAVFAGIQLCTAGVVATNGSCSFELMNVPGKKVKVINNISGRQFGISRNGLPAGIYFFIKFIMLPVYLVPVS